MADSFSADKFGESALTLTGLAARALGWRPAEFWEATPAELAACLADPRSDAEAPPSRTEIEQMMEQDRDGR